MKNQGFAALLAILAVPLVTSVALAAPPRVPPLLSYQGLLLDEFGQPRTGDVDLTVRVYDAVVGGALVYRQSFPSVALAEGVYTVQLGPAGDATDVPVNPLTSDLATALAGDAGPTAPLRFLEVTVGSEDPLTRTQIVSSAYALRAATAETATVAQSAGKIGGVDAAFVTQIFQNFNFDGGPPNNDPREGLGDTDGDGIANFVDADNDNDGVSDEAEIANGTDMNLVTPDLVSITPDTLYYLDSAVLTVQGKGFLPGLTFTLGSLTPVPSNVTPTSFQVAVDPPLGPGIVDATVTNPNGQSDLVSSIFTFTASLATNSIVLSKNTTTVDMKTGTTTAVVGGLQGYGVGTGAALEFPLASRSNGSIGMTWTPSGAVAGLRCRDLGTTCAVEILVDSDADNALEDETGIPIETVSGGTPALKAADLSTDPSGHWVAGYVRRGTNANPIVAHDRNGDGDFADANELVVVDGPLGNGGVTPADLAVDSAGRVAYVYVSNFMKKVSSVWDRNGDGDYDDTISGNPEKAVIASGSTVCLGATFDASDHLVVIWGPTGTAGPQLLRDGNGDGDFLDAGEQVALAPGSAVTACDVARKPGQPLVAMHNAGGLQLLVDKNGDGDFADAGETTAFPQASGPEAQLGLNGTDRAVIALPGEVVLGTTN